MTVINDILTLMRLKKHVIFAEDKVVPYKKPKLKKKVSNHKKSRTWQKVKK